MPSVFIKSTTLSGKDSKREKSQGIKYTKTVEYGFSVMGITFDGREFEKEFVKGIYDSHEPVNGAVDTVKYLSKIHTLCRKQRSL